MPNNAVWWNRISQLVTCGNARPDEVIATPPSSHVEQQPKVDINLLPSGEGAIVSVISPKRPQDSEIADSHVPVDIVLVIDVSGSMNAAAPAPSEAGTADGVREDFNLSVLDLTKHAARTIMETLNEGDRLAIVTFSHSATVLQPLTDMTRGNKLHTEAIINDMKPLTTTNLWAGIMNGLDQFKPLEADSNRVPALMVLTDGMPNHGMPPKGYLARLRGMAPLPATIHTFGFGYNIDSCLLRCISEAGSGNYSFIPDAGMIGTVFIHAVAHLQTTYATKCILAIQTPPAVKLSTISGPSINGAISDDDSFQATALNNILRLDLGNLQYGQSRDIYLECQNTSGHSTTFEQVLSTDKLGRASIGPEKPVVTGRLTYSLTRKTSETVTAQKSLLSHPRSSRESPMAESMIRYHKSRAMICEFLGSFMKPHPFSGYISIPSHTPNALEAHRDRLKLLLETIPAREQYHTTTTDLEDIITSQTQAKLHKKLLNSLLLDLEGQVSIALSRQEYFNKWALPYFVSLSHAHDRQLCNTFKDPGVQQYNQNDFFRKCRDALDEAFDKIEPPAPSRAMPGPRANFRLSLPGLEAQHHRGLGGDEFSARSLSSWRAPMPGSSSGGTAAPPPPYSPSARGRTAPPAYTSSRINMAAYNDRDSGCFAGDTMVQLASEDGQASQRIPISDLRRGSLVYTPLGARRVHYIVQSTVVNLAMCRIRSGPSSHGGFLVTPWHPIRIETICSSDSSNNPSADSDSWIFPSNAPHLFTSLDRVPYTGTIFSILLEPDVSPAAHAILVSGPPSDENPSPTECPASGSSNPLESTNIWGVTLGHGITAPFASIEGRKTIDARVHRFFGDYAAVEASLTEILESTAEGEQGAKKQGVKRKTEEQQESESGNSKRTKTSHHDQDIGRVDLGVVTIAGLKRDEGGDGLVCGFQGA